MYFPVAYDAINAAVECSNLDRILYPHKNCFPPPPTPTCYTSTPPTASATPTTSSIASHHLSYKALGAAIIVTLLVISILGLGIALLYDWKKSSRRARPEQSADNAGSVRTDRTCSLGSRLSSRRNLSRAGREARPGEVEMGRFKRGLSRVRSMAKSSTKVQIQVQAPPRMRAGEIPDTRESQRAPSAAVQRSNRRASRVRIDALAASRHPATQSPESCDPIPVRRWRQNSNGPGNIRSLEAFADESYPEPSLVDSAQNSNDSDRRANWHAHLGALEARLQAARLEVASTRSTHPPFCTDADRMRRVETSWTLPVTSQFVTTSITPERRSNSPVEARRMTTPPPTYGQRVGDRYVWEDDGEPAPDYTSWNPWR